MSRTTTLGFGLVAIAAGAVLLNPITAQAEPYGGFANCDTRPIHYDYGPRYEPTVRRTYADSSRYVAYRRAYTGGTVVRPVYAEPSRGTTYVRPRTRYVEPAYRTRTVVRTVPTVRYARPAVRRTVHLGAGYGHYPRPVRHVRHYRPAVRRHYVTPIRSHSGHRHYTRPRYYSRHRHGSGFGFSIGGGRHGGGFGFSFHRNRH